ncbi:MAG TPA: efflux RND transporter periplasmic adaptor subunit [Luteibaculaceae bacterium]|nr:efflux RND transporter periplasmic adaptor subunit [Luteibaculaceae bacterium]
MPIKLRQVYAVSIIWVNLYFFTMKQMKFGSWVLVCLVFCTGCAEMSSEVLPLRREVVQAVYANGSIESENEIAVVSQRNATIVSLVEAGDTLEAGDVIAVLDDGYTHAKTAALIQAYELARENTLPDGQQNQEWAEKMRVAAQKLEFDSIQFERATRLRSSDAASRVEWERSKLVYATSKAEMNQLQLNYQWAVKRRQLEAQQAKTQLEAQRFDESCQVVTAPSAGVVFKTYKNKGEFIRVGEPLARFGSINHMVAKVKIDEQDISKIHVGQPSLLHLEALPGRSFKGKVKRIHPWVESRDQTVLVEIAFDEPKSWSQTGLTVEANILVRHDKQQLTVPVEYLVQGDSLHIKRNGKITVLPVETGVRTNEWVEIRKGLRSNDIVVRP